MTTSSSSSSSSRQTGVTQTMAFGIIVISCMLLVAVALIFCLSAETLTQHEVRYFFLCFCFLAVNAYTLACNTKW